MSRPAFAVPFSWDSAIGRAVELVAGAVPPGPVVEIGAGRGAAAERFRHRGFDYAALVERDDDARDLAERGFDAGAADLRDAAAVADALARLTGGREVGAVIALDATSRMSAGTLAVLAAFVEARPMAAFATSTGPGRDDTVVALPGTGPALVRLLHAAQVEVERSAEALAVSDALARRLDRRPVRAASRLVGLADRIRRRVNR